MTPLILASTSRYRRELLARLGLPFRTESPGVDETHLPGETPFSRASRLAQLKAQAVAERFPEAVVIGSDQVAALGDEILDKPGDEIRCREQLSRLSGSKAAFYTAFCVAQASRNLSRSHVDTTVVQFRALTPEEISRYVERERPFDCAGGFKSEGLGITLFESIRSQDPTALIGLPLIALAEELRRAGYALP